MTELITPQYIKQMLDKLDQRHAEIVHYLFVNHYVDNGDDYEFRDEWLVDNYIEAYSDAFEDGKLRPLNRYVVKVLKEWYRDSYPRFLEAADDLIAWMQKDVRTFEPTFGKEIDSAYDKAIKADNADAVWKALIPFVTPVVKQIKAKKYEDAASNLYCIIEKLGQTFVQHEDWFRLDFHDEVNGDYSAEITDIVNFQDLIFAIYSHLRQKPDLPQDLKNEMDIHLHIFNQKTHYLGDIWGDSSISDMFSDHNDQFGDYTKIEDNYTWQWYQYHRHVL